VSTQRVRLGSEPIVHSVAPEGWTTCGIMNSTEANAFHFMKATAFHFMKATATDDPVDCMACLVQEARGDVATLMIRGIIKMPMSMPVHVIKFVIDTEPKK
jgi:hypothetical protein